MNKDHLIRIGILIEVIPHAFLWSGQHDVTVVIHQNRYATFQKVLRRWNAKTLETSMLQHLFLSHLGSNAYLGLRPYDLGRRMNMVEQRIIIGESFGRE